MAMTKPKRRLTGDPTSVWGEGMPDWLSGLIGDDDNRRKQLMDWMGNSFASWTEGQKTKNAGMFKEVAAGHYMSQRQKEELLNPEGKATRLERIGFHGGFVQDEEGNRRWTNNYDEWVKGGRFHVPTKSFGPVAVRNKVPDTVKQQVIVSAKKSGDYRGVKARSDGGLDFFFGQPGLEKKRAAAVRTTQAVEAHNKINEIFDLLNSNADVDANGNPKPGSLNEDGTPKRTVGSVAREGNAGHRFDYEGAVRDNTTDTPDFIKKPVNAVRDFLSGLFGADRGGQTMRERGWLDVAFGGATVRQVAKGGKSR